LLEVLVGFTVLGIGLAGLCPLVVMQLRQVRQLERRFQGHVVQRNFVNGATYTMLPGTTHYLVPWKNPWTQKLAGSSQLLSTNANACDLDPPPLPSPTPTAFPVTVVALDAPPHSQDVTVHVLVSAP
jgi:hypothetical protein